MKLKILSLAIVVLTSIVGFGQNKKNTSTTTVKKVQGTMTVSDGMLNGQKTMLSKAQIFGDILYLVEGETAKMPIVISAGKNETIAIAKFVNANFEITITLPLVVNAKGYLVTTGKAIVRNKDTGVIDGKTTTKKVTLAKKNQYVGHVTLLR
jgi:hypothetical protein